MPFPRPRRWFRWQLGGRDTGGARHLNRTLNCFQMLAESWDSLFPRFSPRPEVMNQRIRGSADFRLTRAGSSGKAKRT